LTRPSCGSLIPNSSGAGMLILAQECSGADAMPYLLNGTLTSRRWVARFRACSNPA
jgi:hypothetical protein